jgi:hypothetical protein
MEPEGSRIAIGTWAVWVQTILLNSNIISSSHYASIAFALFVCPFVCLSAYNNSRIAEHIFDKFDVKELY